MTAPTTRGNIFAGIPRALPEELFENILSAPGFKLERIVSKGHATPPGQWYDQDRDEWVLLLQGSAGLRLDGEEHVLILERGDYIHLPAHRRHRVEWTAPTTETVWLALHFPA